MSTDISVTSTSYQVEKRSWLIPQPGAVGPGYTPSVAVLPSLFTAGTHYPNGFIPSGTPLAKVGGLMVPYTSAEATTTNAGVLAGHLFSDQQVVGTNDFGVPVLDHGRVKAAKVPQGSDAFTAPVAAAKRAAVTIVYI